MKPATGIATDVDDYIARHAPEIQARLAAMRATIRRHAPSAEERISYRMPAYYLGGYLVYFAAFERHIGFYPGAAGIAAFTKDVARFKSAKGSVQFPHTEPLPLDLVAQMVQFRVADQAAKQAVKNAARGRSRHA